MTLQPTILATLAYHDIFNYPLTSDQIYNFLPKKASRKIFERDLAFLTNSRRLMAKSNLYCLAHRQGLIKKYYQKNQISAKKLKIANKYANLLKLIPTVKFVALTGALAMGNSTQQDDIDFLIVTAKNQLWTTRLAANLVLFPNRRKPGEGSARNKACLNIFISESSLKIRTQNLYTAHEVAQTKPLWQRENTYQKYINANSWVKNHLPNWQPYSPDSYTTYSSSERSESRSSRQARTIIETFAKYIQLRYMHNKITTEKIGGTQLFFHPSDTQKWVLEEYTKRLASLHRTK